MRDIHISHNREQVIFEKKLYHDTEIILAKCFGFTTDIDKGLIICEIKFTAKKALFEFIKLGFKSFSEAPDREEERRRFYKNIDEIYDELNSNADEYSRYYLPYYEQLFQHQKEVLCESFYKKYNFLALDMGLGKTLTSASLSRVHNIPLTVIICPAAVKWNWFHDLIKFGYNQMYFTMLDAAKRRTFRAFSERFIILNYDIVDKFGPELVTKDIGHFIFDESHNLKNHLSARTKNVAKLLALYPNARVTFLSGTPIKNRVNDIFSYLKLIKHELGSSHKKFLDEFTINSSSRGGDRVTGGKNLAELHTKLSNFMIRRTKEECLDLPEKIFLNYKFELDDYRNDYNKIIEELSQQKAFSSLSGNIHSLNIITANAKKKGIIEIAETIIGEGRKVVIFGGYKQPLNDLEEYFGERCVKIDGSVESFVRNELVNKFIDDESCVVFLGNWVAAGVGINLVNSSDIIVQSFPLTPAELFQGIDRLHRIGQNSAVNVHYTFCEDSIDEYIHDIIVDKEKDINAVVDQHKDVILRENMTEILLKKLLKRDDIIFENPHPHKTTSVATGEEVTAHEVTALTEPERALLSEPKEVHEMDIPLPPRSPDAIDKYHLIIHEPSDTLFILNEEEFFTYGEPESQEIFAHEDITEIFKKGMHYRQKNTCDFDNRYTANPVKLPEPTNEATKAVPFFTAPPNFL
jgi:SNF2 family DNA or RNA helicase